MSALKPVHIDPCQDWQKITDRLPISWLSLFSPGVLILQHLSRTHSMSYNHGVMPGMACPRKHNPTTDYYVFIEITTFRWTWCYPPSTPTFASSSVSSRKTYG